ncbi:hypothetical protein G6F22_017255 [Rhizopus arrhizus]|nr:hypothetical protein G6F22_017255 [Rhizopus arrhizus]
MRTVMNDHGRARTDARRPRPARRALLCCAVLLSLAAPAGAMAAETTMVKLIKGLIASGALKPEDGQALLVQAEAEAAAAQRTAASGSSAASGGVALEAGDVRVPYVPQSVRDGIRDEVRQDVMAQAKSEGWAAPNEVAEWTKRIKVTGDMRQLAGDQFRQWLRYQHQHQPAAAAAVEQPPGPPQPVAHPCPPGHRSDHRPAHHRRRAPGQRQQ